MSDPIKPPGGPLSGPGPIEEDGTHQIQGTQKTNEETASVQQAQSGQAVQSSAQTERLTQITNDIKSGKLSVPQAIDQLVELTVQHLPNSYVTPQIRAEIQQSLKHALQTDPNMLELVRDLERSF